MPIEAQFIYLFYEEVEAGLMDTVEVDRWRKHIFNGSRTDEKIL